MNLQQHYDALWAKSLHQFEQNAFEFDDLIDDPTDTRLGLTVRFQASMDIRHQIELFLNALKNVEPDQYYYPISEMHGTLLTVLTCYQDFDVSTIDTQKYTDVLAKTLQNMPPFTVHFKGITASPSCILIQGFPMEGHLNNIRNALRSAFKNTDLQQSIDQRYTIQTAHSTVVRFKHPLPKESGCRSSISNSADFIRILKDYRTHDFGKATIHEVELVANDWYHRTRNLVKIATIPLL
jgi:2'-5' RNA ligase